MNKLRIGFVATNDPLGFCQDYSERARNFFAQQEVEIVLSPNTIISAESAREAMAFFNGKHVDCVLLQCCALAGDGNIIIPFAESNIPLFVWCVPEPLPDGPLPLNSMTCANIYMSVVNSMLNNSMNRVKWLYGDIDDPLFADRLSVSLASIKAIKHLRNSRVARVGGTAEGFINLQFDQAAYESKLGVKIFEHDLTEVLSGMKGLGSKEVDAMVKDLSRKRRTNEVSVNHLESSARLMIYLRKFASQNSYDALAVSCWPEFQVKAGISTCMAYAILNDSGLVCACEGDLPGAISMMILSNVAKRSPMIMDMVAMDEKEDAITFWHCGLGLPSYADENGYCLIKYPSYPENFDEPPVSINAKFAPQAATVFRIHGYKELRLFALTSQIVEGPSNSYLGSRGWFSNFWMQGKKLSAADLFNTLMVNGMPHHYVIAGGHVEQSLLEFAKRMDLDIVKPLSYQHSL